jgi:hypothetical protein
VQVQMLAAVDAGRRRLLGGELVPLRLGLHLRHVTLLERRLNRLYCSQRCRATRPTVTAAPTPRQASAISSQCSIGPRTAAAIIAAKMAAIGPPQPPPELWCSG